MIRRAAALLLLLLLPGCAACRPSVSLHAACSAINDSNQSCNLRTGEFAPVGIVDCSKLLED